MSRARRRMLLLLWVFLPALHAAALENPAPDEGGATLRSTVTDDAGEPLAGARVWALAPEEVVTPEGFQAASSSTGADGSFAVPGLPSDAALDLWVCSDGFLASFQSIASADELVRVAMQPSGTVYGRVFGPGGEPLAGAGVQISEPPGFCNLMRTATPCGSGEPAMTDAEGRFALVGIAPAWIELKAHAPGLEDGQSERFLVRAGEPVEGIEIHLTPVVTQEEVDP